jgi:lysophospholipase L1-like esterase
MEYPAQLSRLLGRPVINAGVPGDTTASALRRLDQDVLERSPSIVLITLGGNDLKNGVPAEVAFGNLQMLVEALQARGARVVLGGIKIPFYGSDYSQGYRTVAERTGAVLVPDILEDIYGRRDRMSDPIHPNDAGYAMVARRFFEAMPHR